MSARSRGQGPLKNGTRGGLERQGATRGGSNDAEVVLSRDDKGQK